MEQVISWKSTKIIATLLVSLFGLFSLLILSQQVNAPVVFTDPNLEQVVREKIEKPIEPIYRTDLASIIELEVAGRDIHSLEGIENLKRLVELNLANNTVEDLSPLARLRMLKVLNLANNQITDLEAVHFDQITHLGLRELYLQDNRSADGQTLSDITLVGHFTDLEILNLRHNEVNDLSPLANLSELHELDLRGNQVADVGPLQNLTRLKVLNLRDNAISNLEPLGGLTELVYLNIHSNPVLRGVAVLGNLKELNTLIMRNVHIGDAYPFLENLTQLRRLNIRNTGIVNVAVVSNLMKAGALQDNPETGVKAAVDLLEINPEATGDDPYLTLRRYWDNISIRYPLSLPYYPSPIKSPSFSHISGFYKESFYLTLTADDPGTRIFYTLDGSEPALTPDMQPMAATREYTEAISIEDRTSQPNTLSSIETAYWIPQHIPPDEVFKGSVVRAVALSQDGIRSDLSTHSYFITDRLSEQFSISVVSIVSDPDYLFGDRLGIYVPGDTFIPPAPDQHWTEETANFFQRGLKWERPATFQLFDQTGTLLLDQNVGIRVHGGYTRGFNQKSLRVIASDDYDNQGVLAYDLFPNLNNRVNNEPVDTFTSLILRSGGNDWRIAIFRDVLAHSLLEPTLLDIQGYLPVIVFINGEYWGIHNIRTRYDDHYFAAYYGISNENLVVLEDNGFGTEVIMGDPNGLNAYFDLLRIIDPNFIENGFQTAPTLSDPQAYAAIINEIDLENFTTYFSAQVYFNNSDWPYNNVRFWRKLTDINEPEQGEPYGHDLKWRWMVLDVDRALRGDVTNDNLSLATERLQIENYLFRALLQNDTFQYQYINRFADLLNSVFREEVVVDKINKFESIYTPEIEGQIHRWGQPAASLDAWLSAVAEMREFAILRPGYVRQHLIDYFKLAGLSNLTLQTDPTMGFIQVNSLSIQTGQVGVEDPSNWTGDYFQGVPFQLTAHALPGHTFVRWDGVDSLDVDPESSTIQVALSEDKIITAIFVQE